MLESCMLPKYVFVGFVCNHRCHIQINLYNLESCIFKFNLHQKGVTTELEYFIVMTDDLVIC